MSYFGLHIFTSFCSTFVLESDVSVNDRRWNDCSGVRGRAHHLHASLKLFEHVTDLQKFKMSRYFNEKTFHMLFISIFDGVPILLDVEFVGDLFHTLSVREALLCYFS